MKNAIVTGAGGGIGACITELAVNLGYRVAAIDVRPGSVNELAFRTSST
jgi:NAD(P)-dependent dehydrogenase (short-subunit alcohol dehydrogenase family)